LITELKIWGIGIVIVSFIALLIFIPYNGLPLIVWFFFGSLLLNIIYFLGSFALWTYEKERNK